MYKVLLFSIICIFSLNTMHAQSRSSKKRRSRKKTELKSTKGTWIGMNTTGLLKNVFSLTSPNTSDPYTITALFSKGAKGVRIGSYLEYQNKVNIDNTSEILFTVIRSGLRLGLQKEFFVRGGFFYYYGFDLPISYHVSRSSANDINYTVASWLAGVGPVIGFGYQIGDRLRLSTESSYYFSYGRSTKTLEVQGDNQKEHKSLSKITHLLPNSLYISFRL